MADVAGSTSTNRADQTEYVPPGPFGDGSASPIDFYNSFANIVGSPHSFMPSADPGKRTFSRHMLTVPPLVSIRAGRVKYTSTKDLAKQLSASLGIDEKDVDSIFRVGGDSQDSVFSMSKQYGPGEEGGLEALLKAVKEKVVGTVQDLGEGGTPPIRYFEFEPKVDEYMSVVATQSARIYARMTGKTGTTLPWLDTGAKGQPKPQSYGGFSTYWADNATSVSESAHAEVGATAVARAVKGLADISNEAQFALNSRWSENGDSSGNVGSSIKKLMDKVGLGRNAAVGSAGIGTAVGDAILGINPLFPEVWKDSGFSRSYDLSFKFHTPYGTPGAVFQNVLLPFVQLLSLVLPILRNPGTYSEPFVFQLDVPGHFSCDLGICTDFTFTKGGAEHLWTKDGLPRQIDVTMRVKDLYPTLASSHNNKSLYCNVGMGSFLDNLAGIKLFESGQGLNPITVLQAKLQSALIQGKSIPSRLENDLTNLLFQKGSVGNLFRGVFGGGPAGPGG